MLKRNLSVWTITFGVNLLLTMFVAIPSGIAEEEESLLQPLPNLTSEQQDEFQKGLVLFTEKWHEDDGVGPRYNGYRCSDCHRSPEAGGAGSRSSSVFFFGTQHDNGFDPLLEQDGPILKTMAVRGASLNPIPDNANVVSLRTAPTLFGLGLVEAIPDSQILALADENDIDGDGVSGRAVLTSDGRVQRFGTQSTAATLRSFVEGDLHDQLGLTAHEVSTETMRLLRSFIAYSAPLPRQDLTKEVKKGERNFQRMGCAVCHTTSFTTSSEGFRTADDDTFDVDALKNREVHPYSDFLLHDMGPALDDGVGLGEANSSEYRTRPLWGLKHRHDRQLHDGRARNVHQAILFHGGEALASREAYMMLNSKKRRAVEAFLLSL